MKIGKAHVGTSNPFKERPAFEPRVKEYVLKHTGLYSVLHNLHLVRMEEVRRLTRCLDPGKRLLDVGCGDGFFTRRISDALKAPTVGIDLMESRIERARYYNVTSRCDFVLGDATALPFEDQCFEQVVSVGCLEHFDDDQAVLSEMHRVLKPGGRVAISCDAFYNIAMDEGRRKAHAQKYYVHRFYTPETLRACLEAAGFIVDSVEGIFSSTISIKLVDGAYRFGCDWSNPIYNAYSAIADPMVRVAEALSGAQDARGVYLLASCRRPVS
jgi:ubiquinone/menaquinone biosynthesis C-methylase UbiE